MTARYAEGTRSSEEKSIREIKSALSRYKATGFGYMETPMQFSVMFEMQGRKVRFTIPIPDMKESSKTPTGKRRTTEGTVTAHQQEVKRRYRALLLVIKAKLESIISGIETFEESFMAQLVLPSGKTISEEIIPQLPRLGSGDTPRLGSSK